MLKKNDVVVVLNTDNFYEEGSGAGVIKRFLMTLGVVESRDSSDNPLPYTVTLFDTDERSHREFFSSTKGVVSGYFSEDNLEKIGEL